MCDCEPEDVAIGVSIIVTVCVCIFRVLTKFSKISKRSANLSDFWHIRDHSLYLIPDPKWKCSEYGITQKHEYGYSHSGSNHISHVCSTPFEFADYQSPNCKGNDPRKPFYCLGEICSLGKDNHTRDKYCNGSIKR